MLFAARVPLHELCGTVAWCEEGRLEVACVTTSAVLAK